MPRSSFHASFYASTALSLCLISAPGFAWSEEVVPTADDVEQFAPLVRPCVESGGGDECADFRSLIAECADSFERVRCEVLFEDGQAVFDDDETRERMAGVLEYVAGNLPDFPSPGPDDLPEAALDAARSDAEAGLLRADDNQMTHSTPPLVEGEDEGDEVEAEDPPEREPEADEAAAEAEVEVEAELEAAIVDQIATDDEPAVEEDELAVEEEAEAPAAPSEDLPEAAAPQAEAATTAAEAEADTEVREEQDPAASLAAMVEALQAERDALLAEAEDMGDEAPELLVEDVPEETVEAPTDPTYEPDATQQTAIDRMLESPEVSAAVGTLGAALGLQLGQDPDEADAPPAAIGALRDSDDPDVSDEDAPAEVLEQEITADQMRSSREDFDSRLALDFDADAVRSESARDRRRDLERAGLVALGALAVGMIVNQNRVVARSDERVVVDQGGGDLALWRDDDAILLQDGSVRRIERYDDGSTRTRWLRTDGTQVITIRDATGRVLRRERVLTDGTIIEIVDDTRAATPVVIEDLPPLRYRELRMTQRTDPELALAMLREAEADARAVERSFSLRQIRDVREVRELAPLLSPEPVTFETNRANIRSEEAPKLVQVGRLMERLIADNPSEVFLIEGHTDATGPAAFNLALSDRRAESVALALTEFFDIPPENLIVQGYGKRYLRIPTLQSEERNRRVAIRRISPLLGLDS